MNSPIELLEPTEKTLVLAAIETIEKKKGKSYAPTAAEIQRQMEVTTIRKEHAKAPRFSADKTHEAWICVTDGRYGVSYWTPAEVANYKRKNSDNTVTEIIEPLYN